MKSLKLLAALALASAFTSHAEEGMWMPRQIPALADRLSALGYKGDPKIFADLTGFPMGAIVSLGGCSASFVSPDGLIVTNHHCVQSYLQYNSKPDKNLMVDGFLARTRSEELWNGPGSRVLVTVAVEDVTESVLGGLSKDLSDRERHEQIEKRIKALTAEREKQEGYRCTLSSFFEGLSYFAITQLEIKDVRLVYAPAAGIGNFGGETDNWQWPRHTGDFSYIRAYVSKDGKPAAYAKDNVPFHPKHFLKVSTLGASPGEVIFVAGYPGRTARLSTYDSVKETVEYSLPRIVKRNTEQIALLEKLSAEDKETALRVSTRIRGFNNSLTKNKGVLEGMLKGGLLAQKEAKEKALLAWIAAEPARAAKYASVIPAIAALNAERAKTRERNALLGEFAGSMSSAIGAAETIYRFAVEKAKPDAERDPAFQERNWPRIREGLDRLQRIIDPKADRTLMKYFLADIAKLPPSQRIEILDKAAGLNPGMPERETATAIDRYVDGLIVSSKLYTKAYRLFLLDQSPAELAATQDPLLALTIALYPMQKEIREASKTRSGAMARLGPLYAEALLAKEGSLVAPDANSTLRVTYGTVKGVEIRDGLLHLPQTTLKGVSQKATGTGEFDAPLAQLNALKALRAGKASPYLAPALGDVPVNFLSTVDTTGGNSGSATLNAKGELIGLLFDGTYDTVASDYFFDAERTRSIHCDTRYMLWVMTEVDKADNLLRELSLSTTR
jgi:hypothetical protein